MQGWSPDFIPKLPEDAVSGKWIDKVLPVDGNEALRLARELARKEGIFAGISAGATLAGAMEICKSAEHGANVLCMLPDTGERYLSTPLFDDVPEAMTEEEWAFSRSTPAARFDAPATAAPVPEPEPVDAEAAHFVASVIDGEPVVMFAHEWCEFCWSVRKLFGHYGIDYRSIDMDSVEYADNDRGRKIRVALQSRTGVRTVPQVFVGGEFIGGCTETFDAFINGGLQRKLVETGVVYDQSVKADPYGFLPKWLQPR
jgi:cysteine synthase A